MSQASAMSIAVDLIAGLQHGPKTREELQEYAGVCSTTVTKFIREGRGAGVIYTHGWRPARGGRSRPTEIIALQPKPFAHDDVPFEAKR